MGREHLGKVVAGMFHVFAHWAGGVSSCKNVKYTSLVVQHSRCVPRLIETPGLGDYNPDEQNPWQVRVYPRVLG